MPGALGPRTVPLFIMSSIVVLSMLIALLEVVKLVRARGIAHARGLAPAAAGDERVSLARVILVLAAIVAFAAVWRYLGFFGTSIVFIAGLAYLLAPPDQRSAPSAVLLALVFTVLSWLLFRFILGVPLPGGTMFGA